MQKRSDKSSPLSLPNTPMNLVPGPVTLARWSLEGWKRVTGWAENWEKVMPGILGRVMPRSFPGRGMPRSFPGMELDDILAGDHQGSSSGMALVA